MIDALTAAVFKSEFKKLLIAETGLRGVELLNSVVLLAQEVLEGDGFVVQLRMNTD